MNLISQSRTYLEFLFFCAHWTPLHYAALKGSLEMVQFLLSQGADPDVETVCPAFKVMSYCHVSGVSFVTCRTAFQIAANRRAKNIKTCLAPRD